MKEVSMRRVITRTTTMRMRTMTTRGPGLTNKTTNTTRKESTRVQFVTHSISLINNWMVRRF